MARQLATDRIADLVLKFGVQDIVEFALEFAGPFTFLAAQAAYLIEPLTGDSRGLVHDLGQILENDREVEGLLDRIHYKRDQK
jgi:hypothetical protein